MKTSKVLLSLSLSNIALGLIRRNALQSLDSASGTSTQPKRYIVEFEPVSNQ